MLEFPIFVSAKSVAFYSISDNLYCKCEKKSVKYLRINDQLYVERMSAIDQYGNSPTPGPLWVAKKF